MTLTPTASVNARLTFSTPPLLRLHSQRTSTQPKPDPPPHSPPLPPPSPTLPHHCTLCTQIDEPELSAYVRYLGYRPKKNEVEDMIWEVLSSPASTSASASATASASASASASVSASASASPSPLPHQFLRPTPHHHPENALSPYTHTHSHTHPLGPIPHPFPPFLIAPHPSPCDLGGGREWRRCDRLGRVPAHVCRAAYPTK